MLTARASNVGEGSPVANRKLPVDMVQVKFDCALGDIEAVRDFFVGQTLSCQEHDLLFAHGQDVVEPSRLIALLPSTSGGILNQVRRKAIFGWPRLPADNARPPRGRSSGFRGLVGRSRCASPGSRPLPAPPGKKTAASEHQTRQSSTSDGAGDTEGKQLASDLTTRVSHGVDVKIGLSALDSR